MIFDNLVVFKSGILINVRAPMSGQPLWLSQDSSDGRLRDLDRYFTAPFPGADLGSNHELDVPSDSLERWIHVAKLLRAYGGCLGVRSR